MSNGDRSFNELYDKFDDVYNRLTMGRRDMKAFHDFINQCQSASDRFGKDMDSAVKKAVNATTTGTLASSYGECREAAGQISKQHHSVAAIYKEMGVELEKAVKDIKTNKTKLHDTHTKLYKDMESKKQTHLKSKITYEDTVKKAETAVLSFRAGRAQAGNEKAVRKLEDAVASATKDLERNHMSYIKAVRECQASQSKYESETASMLSQFEELERKRLSTFQELISRFVQTQESVKTCMDQVYLALAKSTANINVTFDVASFITETYTGNAPEPHANYEPRTSEIIPHYGDDSAIQESAAHQKQTQSTHAFMMRNSSNPPPAPINSNPTFTAPPPSSAPEQTVSLSAFTSPSFSSPVAAAAASSEPLAKALYDFNGQEDGDLSFAAGDTVTLIACDANEEWWHGSVHGRIGTFPRDYVTRLDNNSPSSSSSSAATPVAPPTFYEPTPEPYSAPPPAFVEPASNIPAGMKEARAMYPFQGQAEDELTFEAGDLLYVSNEIDGWFEGALKTTGQKGIFPANYVELL